ncbi:MAG: hypothetical protein AMXMBFR84_06480 [Candidatus Hydrogenedentota bacterium]
MKIEFLGVTKRFRKIYALDNVNLEIAPGQIVAVLGNNGAGKTTLLRCLSGILAPDRGQVMLDGDLFTRDRMDLRRRLNVLPDFPVVIEEWPILRQIALTLRLYRRDDAGSGSRVADLLAEFDLLPLAEVPFNKLSRGQRYKAALVALLAVDPELWLLDEPFASGMDPAGIAAFRRHAQAAANRGSTILYTTQILEIVETFSDRICVLHKGQVYAFDSIDRLRDRETGGTGSLADIFQQLSEEDPP